MEEIHKWLGTTFRLEKWFDDGSRIASRGVNRLSFGAAPAALKIQQCSDRRSGTAQANGKDRMVRGYPHAVWSYVGT